MVPPELRVQAANSTHTRRKGTRRKKKSKKAQGSSVHQDAYVNKLPYELLSEIFAHYIRDATRRVPPGWPRKNPYNWLAITHVCHKWRAVALDTKRFWCNISLNCVDAAEVFVRRSGKKSLVIQGALWCGDTEDERRLAVLKECAGRIRSLELTISTGLLRRLGRECGQRMVKLEELTLERQGDGSNKDETKLLAKFISRNLKKLAIRQFTFLSFDPILSPTITDLCLDTGSVLYVFSTQDMLATLKKIPALERLAVTISFSAPQNAGIAAPIQGPVVLPELKELRMRISTAEDGKFLTSVEVPHLQVVDFHVSCAGNEDIMPNLTQSIAPVINGLTKRIPCLAAMFGGSAASTLKVTFENLECYSDALHQQVHLDFWHYGSSQSTVLQYAKAYLEPSLEVTKNLTVVDGPYPSDAADAWTGFFSLMRDIRSMRGDGILTVPHGFSYRESNGTEPPLFPRLESVILDSLDFGAAQLELGTFMKGLIRSFQSRANARQIKNLTILNGIGIDLEDYKALEHCVQTFSCDGIPSTGASEGKLQGGCEAGEGESDVEGPDE